MLLKYSHTHSFMHCLWLLYCYDHRTGTGTLWLTNPTIFTISSFSENIATNAHLILLIIPLSKIYFQSNFLVSKSMFCVVFMDTKDGCILYFESCRIVKWFSKINFKLEQKSFSSAIHWLCKMAFRFSGHHFSYL